MLAIDTNILVYSEIPTLEFHKAARTLVENLIAGSRPWAIPWPCVYEFLRVVTHPVFFVNAVPLERALDDLERIFESPSLHLLSETTRHATILNRLLREVPVKANLIFDARIAALCIEHDIDEILTADHDFTRFPVNATNPFA